MSLDYYKDFKLAIIDDYFPNLKTGFRISEFNWYFKNLAHATVFTFPNSFNNNILKYSEVYPEFSNNVVMQDENIVEELKKYDIVYAVFDTNAYRAIKLVNKAKKPFVFTLYPGGGFALDNEESDKRLLSIFQNPHFKKVIVTQKITYDYIINKNLVQKDKVEFIYGVVTNQPKLIENKKLYKKDKKTFDICFVAHKYPNDKKGYDIFIDVCKILSELDEDFRFHVVGGYGRSAIDVSDLKNKIQFYGIRNEEFFQTFHSKMDIMISPNRVSKEYGFDGFPTTCGINAVLNATALFVTDQLNLNVCLKDKEEIVIVDESVEDIVSKVLYYKNNLDKLYEMSFKGQQKFIETFDSKNQMLDRMRILESALKSND